VDNLVEGYLKAHFASDFLAMAMAGEDNTWGGSIQLSSRSDLPISMLFPQNLGGSADGSPYRSYYVLERGRCSRCSVVRRTVRFGFYLPIRRHNAPWSRHKSCSSYPSWSSRLLPRISLAKSQNDESYIMGDAIVYPRRIPMSAAAVTLGDWTVLRSMADVLTLSSIRN